MTENPLHDASVVALDLVRVALTGTQLQQAGVSGAGALAISAVKAALERVSAEDLVTAMAAHLVAALAIQNPEDPSAALEELELVSTMHRLDIGEDES